MQRSAIYVRLPCGYRLGHRKKRHNLSNVIDLIPAPQFAQSIRSLMQILAKVMPFIFRIDLYLIMSVTIKRKRASWLAEEEGVNIEECSRIRGEKIVASCHGTSHRVVAFSHRTKFFHPILFDSLLWQGWYVVCSEKHNEGLYLVAHLSPCVRGAGRQKRLPSGVTPLHFFHLNT